MLHDTAKDEQGSDGVEDDEGDNDSRSSVLNHDPLVSLWLFRRKGRTTHLGAKFNIFTLIGTTACVYR